MPDKLVSCSFCQRDHTQTLRMVRKDDVIICRDCVVYCVDALTKNEPKFPRSSGGRKRYLAQELGRNCSFCSRKVIDVRAALSPKPDSKHDICDECVMICFDIMLRGIFGKRIISKDTISYLVYVKP